MGKDLYKGCQVVKGSLSAGSVYASTSPACLLPMHILMLSDMSGKVPSALYNEKLDLVLYAAQHQGAPSLGTWDLCLLLCPIKRTNTWDLRTLKN